MFASRIRKNHELRGRNALLEVGEGRQGKMTETMENRGTKTGENDASLHPSSAIERGSATEGDGKLPRTEQGNTLLAHERKNILPRASLETREARENRGTENGGRKIREAQGRKISENRGGKNSLEATSAIEQGSAPEEESKLPGTEPESRLPRTARDDTSPTGMQPSGEPGASMLENVGQKQKSTPPPVRSRKSVDDAAEAGTDKMILSPVAQSGG